MSVAIRGCWRGSRESEKHLGTQGPRREEEHGELRKYMHRL